MYNRASCDLSGKPWDASRRQVWWNEAAGRWVGNDVPDYKVDSKPSDHMGPFIMNPEGVGRVRTAVGVRRGTISRALRAD
jgi:formate dehydrogenase major subunit